MSSTEDIILNELRSIRAEMAAIRLTQLDQISDIATLKVKTGIWSAFVSACIAFAAIAWK